MSIELQTALISATIAIVTALISAYLTWQQLQREKTNWLAELKSSYAVELYKIRLETYPKILAVIAKLSTRSSEKLTPEIAEQIAQEVNDWFYSAGGLCAEASTRGALIGLREACMSWKEETTPHELRQWRNICVYLLRRDIDVEGLESFDPEDRVSLLAKLKSETSDLFESKSKTKTQKKIADITHGRTNFKVKGRK